MAIYKIVQIGAAGNVGTPVLQALMASGKLDITVITHESSAFIAPDPSVNLVKLNFSNKEALVDALRGNDAMAITMGDMPNFEENSRIIIDAAIEAGVRKILPSEFGNNILHSSGNEDIIYTSKHKAEDYIVKKAGEGAIEYTAIATGPFFDFVLTKEFLGFNIPRRKAIIYSGGDTPFNMTTLATVGASVVAVLSSPERYRNRHIRISDFYVSQNEILNILEDETGSRFAIQGVDVEELKEACNRGLANGEWTGENIVGSVVASVFGGDSAARWGPYDDTENLGVPKKDLRGEIKKFI